MGIKQVLQENRIPVNRYQLIIQPFNVPEVTLVSISGLEEELDAPELPDRTVRSGGRSKPVEFDIMQPTHHDLEVAAMETWYTQCKLALPGYLRLGMLTLFDEAGLLPRRRRTLPNIWLKKRAESDLEMENEGEMHVITWTCQTDQVIVTP